MLFDGKIKVVSDTVEITLVVKNDSKWHLDKLEMNEIESVSEEEESKSPKKPPKKKEKQESRSILRK